MAQGLADDVGKIPMSHALQATLVRAREYASAQSHAQVTLEHLLLSLTEDEEANAVLQACNLDMGRLRNDVAAFLGDLADRVPPGSGAPPAISMALTQVLGYATLAAKQGRRQKIDGAIVLAALIGDGKSMAASFLTAQGLTFQETVRVLQRSAATAPIPPTPQPVAHAPAVNPAPTATTAPAKPLETMQKSRTESILAAARERIEARALQTPRAPATPVTEAAVPTQPNMPEPNPQASERPQSVAAASPALPVSVHSPVELKPTPTPVSSRDQLSSLPPFQPLDSPPEVTAPPSVEPSAPLPGNHHRPPELAQRPASSWAPPPLPLPAIPGTAGPPRPNPNPTIHPPFHPAPPPQPGSDRRPAADVPVPAPWSNPDAAHPPTRPTMRQHDPHPPQPRPEPPSQPTAPPGPQRRGPAPERPRHQEAEAPRLPPIDVAQVSHTVPLRLRVGRPVTVEVRVGRPPMAGLGNGPTPASLRSELVTARAITARLRPAKPGNLAVEILSPETQWDQTNAATGRLTSESAVWRFTLTPKAAGAADILLMITARTVAADGVLADMALPDMVIEAKISPDWVRVAKHYGGAIGLVLGAVALIEILRQTLGIDIGRFVRRMLGI